MNKWLMDGHEWLLPRHCLLCLGAARGLDLCAGCRAALPRLGNACRRCAVPLAAGGLCARCIERPPPFDTAAIPFLYAPPVTSLIHGLKFARRLGSAAVLGALLAEHLLAAGVRRPRCLVPVPLHPARQRVRGFNQSVEIARVLAVRLSVAMKPGLCRRVRPTAAQSSLKSAARRRGNVHQAFVAEYAATGVDHVAIVDDVVTTGATAAALARCLRAAGAARVDLWCVARAIPQRE